jgi:nucleotide-binding universal stress UspA family protein
MLARFASTLAESNHSPLTLLHVLDTSGMSDQQKELARLAAYRKLSGLLPNEARHRYEPILLIREGDPATIILDEAGSLPQDMVILGAPSPSMVSRILTNSVAHRVVVESQCPVITINFADLNAAEEVHEFTCTEEMSTHS